MLQADEERCGPHVLSAKVIITDVRHEKIIILQKYCKNKKTSGCQKSEFLVTFIVFEYFLITIV